MDIHGNPASALMLATQGTSSTPIQAQTDSPYTPLDPHNTVIRLATLVPGKFDDVLVVRLSIINLSSSKVTEYEALSYVWGTGTSPHEAIVNGKALPIGVNLDCALRHLRYESQERVMWIDALCINQSDVTERGFQVQKMGQIYSKASALAIWLGPADEDEERAVRNIEARLDDWNVQTLAAIVRICERPWFQRVWVIQEFVLARATRTVYIGRSSIPWQSFYSFIESAGMGPKSKTWGQDVMARLTFLKAHQRTWLFQMMESVAVSRYPAFCLRHSGHFHATDPRDKVYGILGLLTGHLETLSVYPDYTKSVEEVFIDATTQMVRTNPVALYVGLPLRALPEHQVAEYSVLTGLPSWVTDLTICSRQQSTGFEHNMPTLLNPLDLCTRYDKIREKGLAPLVRVSSDNELHAVGAYIGTIVETSKGLPLSLNPSSNSTQSVYDRILRPRNIPFARYREALSGCYFKGDVYPKYIIKGIPIPAEKKVLFVTKEDQVGIVYHPDALNGIRVGDVVVGLFGVSLPFVLRLTKSGEKYEMVNIANVAGHDHEHLGLESAPEGTAEHDVWNDLERFGLQEYVIV
jgi:hypothetical protein